MTSKSAAIFTATSILAAGGAYSQAPDNGVPSKEAAEWQEIYNPTTGSGWRTKTNSKTGETVSFNPFTSEIWRNPVSGQAEAVLREEWINDGLQSAKQSAARLLNTRSAEDNGIPSKVAKEFTEVRTPTSGGETKTVRNSRTGQEIQYNRQTEELWENPTTGRYEAVVREPKKTGIYDPEFGQKLVDVYNAARGVKNGSGSASVPTSNSTNYPSRNAPSGNGGGTGGGSSPSSRTGNGSGESYYHGSSKDGGRTYGYYEDDAAAARRAAAATRQEDMAPARPSVPSYSPTTNRNVAPAPQPTRNYTPPSAPAPYSPPARTYVPPPAPAPYSPPARTYVAPPASAPYSPPARTYTPYVPPAPVYRPNTSR